MDATYMKFEILRGTVTLSGTVSGKPHEWSVRVIAPGNITTEGETVEKYWDELLREMLRAAYEGANRRRFPERTALSASGAKR